MGCGGNASAAVPVPKQLTIHGHITNSTTRSLMGICQHTNQTYLVNEVNALKNEHTGAKYIGINPSGTIPMMEEGMFKVLGGNHVIFVFLCKHHAGIA